MLLTSRMKLNPLRCPRRSRRTSIRRLGTTILQSALVLVLFIGTGWGTAHPLGQATVGLEREASGTGSLDVYVPRAQDRNLGEPLLSLVNPGLRSGATPALVSNDISSDDDAAGRARSAFARLPLHFIKNEGQTDRRVDFLARAPGYTLFLTGGEAVMAFRQTGGDSLQAEAVAGQGGPRSRPDHGPVRDEALPEAQTAAVRMRLWGRTSPRA